MSDAPERIYAYRDPAYFNGWHTGEPDQFDTVYVRADLYAALEAERDELEAYLMEALNQLDDFKLTLVDCLKSRRHQLRNVEAERDRLRTAAERAEHNLRVAGEQNYHSWIRTADWLCAALEGGDDA